MLALASPPLVPPAVHLFIPLYALICTCVYAHVHMPVCTQVRVALTCARLLVGVRACNKLHTCILSLLRLPSPSPSPSLFCIFLRVKALMSMLKSGLRSRDIITRKSIENSIVVVYSLGGSTNAFLHILAIAHEAEVPLTIQEIGEIGRPVPLLGNMRPHGRWHMSDLSKIGAQQA